MSDEQDEWPSGTRITVAMVLDAVEFIRSISRDDERAHGEEDSLHQDVLKAIVRGDCSDPAACAAAALTTLEIEFERWCA